jgi:hypothetical protein
MFSICDLRLVTRLLNQMGYPSDPRADIPEGDEDIYDCAYAGWDYIEDAAELQQFKEACKELDNRRHKASYPFKASLPRTAVLTPLSSCRMAWLLSAGRTNAAASGNATWKLSVPGGAKCTSFTLLSC